MTLDIFAIVCSFHVFSKSSNTVNINFKHHFQIFVAFCCTAKTITFSNMHIRFIALNLGTPDRFRKGGILSSSCCYTVSQHSTFGIGVSLYSVYGNTSGLVAETLAEFHSWVLEMSPFFAIVDMFGAK